MSIEIWQVPFILCVSFEIWNVSFDWISPTLYEPSITLDLHFGPVPCEFEMTPRVSEFPITCHLMSWASGGRNTNSPPLVHNMDILHSRYRADNGCKTVSNQSTINWCLMPPTCTSAGITQIFHGDGFLLGLLFISNNHHLWSGIHSWLRADPNPRPLYWRSRSHQQPIPRP